LHRGRPGERFAAREAQEPTAEQAEKPPLDGRW
jgi:hypothetical protein